MESIYFGIFVLLIGWVVFWSISNDKAGSVGDQRGMFSMRPPKDRAGTRSPKPFGAGGAADYVGQAEEAPRQDDSPPDPDRAA